MRFVFLFALCVVACSGPAEYTLDDAPLALRDDAGMPGDSAPPTDALRDDAHEVLDSQGADVLHVAEAPDATDPRDASTPERDGGTPGRDAPLAESVGDVPGTDVLDVGVDGTSVDVARAEVGADVAPSDAPPEALCANASNCGGCLAVRLPRFGCGWCAESGRCLYGTETGALRGGCGGGWSTAACR